MYPWRRILLPTDFSTASAWVFDDAVRIAAATNAEIVILHVRMTRHSQPSELRFPADTSLYAYAEQIELEKLRERVARVNASTATRLLVRTAPDPGREICTTAAAEDVDLIVMSTHARHHVAHLFVGSTTQDVLTNTHAPLLAIRYGVHMRKGMQRIVVPVHARQTTAAAMELAAAVAELEKGEVHLVTVCRESDRREAEALLQRLTAGWPSAAPVVTATVTGTDVDREVRRYAERLQADAVFMNGADEPSALKLDILRNASLPVMIVPRA